MVSVSARNRRSRAGAIEAGRAQWPNGAMAELLATPAGIAEGGICEHDDRPRPTGRLAACAPVDRRDRLSAAAAASEAGHIAFGAAVLPEVCRALEAFLYDPWRKCRAFLTSERWQDHELHLIQGNPPTSVMPAYALHCEHRREWTCVSLIGADGCSLLDFTTKVHRRVELYRHVFAGPSSDMPVLLTAFTRGGSAGNETAEVFLLRRSLGWTWVGRLGPAPQFRVSQPLYHAAGSAVLIYTASYCGLSWTLTPNELSLSELSPDESVPAFGPKFPNAKPVQFRVFPLFLAWDIRPGGKPNSRVTCACSDGDGHVVSTFGVEDGVRIHVASFATLCYGLNPLAGTSVVLTLGYSAIFLVDLDTGNRDSVIGIDTSAWSRCFVDEPRRCAVFESGYDIATVPLPDALFPPPACAPACACRAPA